MHLSHIQNKMQEANIYIVSTHEDKADSTAEVNTAAAMVTTSFEMDALSKTKGEEGQEASAEKESVLVTVAVPHLDSKIPYNNGTLSSV